MLNVRAGLNPSWRASLAELRRRPALFGRRRRAGAAVGATLEAAALPKSRPPAKSGSITPGAGENGDGRSLIPCAQTRRPA